MRQVVNDVVNLNLQLDIFGAHVSHQGVSISQTMTAGFI